MFGEIKVNFFTILNLSGDTISFSCTTLNGDNENLVESSWLQGMLHYHSLNNRPMKFPIMSHPFPILCGNQIGD